MSDEKKIKIVNGEGQETFVPESVANDEATLKRLLASFYGTDNFRLDHKEENGEIVIHVVKMAGSKGGASAPLAVLRECSGSENPVVILYRELADVDVTQLSADDVARMQKRIEDALGAGQELYRKMGAARTRLARAASFPAPIPVAGF
jgi:hypothetical protein